MRALPCPPTLLPPIPFRQQGWQPLAVNPQDPLRDTGFSWCPLKVQWDAGVASPECPLSDLRFSMKNPSWIWLVSLVLGGGVNSKGSLDNLGSLAWPQALKGPWAFQKLNKSFTQLIGRLAQANCALEEAKALKKAPF